MWADLLQELRVAQTGVQILFGVLFIAVFQPAFTDLGDTDRALYVTAVVLGAASAGSSSARCPCTGWSRAAASSRRRWCSPPGWPGPGCCCSR